MEMEPHFRQVHEQRRCSREQEQSTTTMNQELTACLVHGNGHAVALPTDELLAALDQVRVENYTQGQRLFSNREAVYAFLQTLKDVMQTCKTLPPGP